MCDRRRKFHFAAAGQQARDDVWSEITGGIYLLSVSGRLTYMTMHLHVASRRIGGRSTKDTVVYCRCCSSAVYEYIAACSRAGVRVQFGNVSLHHV
jgi:hypothetical protein